MTLPLPKYTVASPTLQDGQETSNRCDVNGNLLVSLVTGTSATSLTKAEDAAHVSGDVGIEVLGVRNDNYVNLTSANGDYSPMATDSTGAQQVAWASAVSRLVSSAATTNATVVKATGGAVYKLFGRNNAAATRYVKLYNKATAPTVGTDTPLMVLEVPATSIFALDIDGQYFTTGISYALTTGGADSDTGALTLGDITSLNICYS